MFINNVKPTNTKLDISVVPVVAVETIVAVVAVVAMVASVAEVVEVAVVIGLRYPMSGKLGLWSNAVCYRSVLRRFIVERLSRVVIIY